MSLKVAGRPTAKAAWFALVIASGTDAVAAPGKTSGGKVTSKIATTSLAKIRRGKAITPTRQENGARSLADRAPLAPPRQVFGSTWLLRIALSDRVPQGVIFLVLP
ncbi:hypothetical protein [Lentzea terrae]|uniref:hypothetical protein n=1 Tax=Lentzea terrae TaxID=2200761 RepID=UPI0018E5114F|nr:hypothetical protein [Lentzea terrae]